MSRATLNWAHVQVRGKNSVQQMNDSGKAKNSVGLKPKAKWRKDAKAPSGIVDAELNKISSINNIKLFIEN